MTLHKMANNFEVEAKKSIYFAKWFTKFQVLMLQNVEMYVKGCEYLCKALYFIS